MQSKHTPNSLSLICYFSAVVMLLNGCESTRNATDSTPHSTVNVQQGLNAAMAIDTRKQGRVTGLGVGNSMAPLYGENAVVVTNPIQFEDLKPGLVIVYRNRNGHNVVHKLSHKTGFNWVAVGENNQYIDSDVVTPQNLIGVVYATFHTQSKK